MAAYPQGVAAAPWLAVAAAAEASSAVSYDLDAESVGLWSHALDFLAGVRWLSSQDRVLTMARELNLHVSVGIYSYARRSRNFLSLLRRAGRAGGKVHSIAGIKKAWH